MGKEMVQHIGRSIVENEIFFFHKKVISALRKREQRARRSKSVQDYMKSQKRQLGVQSLIHKEREAGKEMEGK